MTVAEGGGPGSQTASIVDAGLIGRIDKENKRHQERHKRDYACYGCADCQPANPPPLSHFAFGLQARLATLAQEIVFDLRYLVRMGLRPLLHLVQRLSGQ